MKIQAMTLDQLIEALGLGEMFKDQESTIASEEQRRADALMGQYRIEVVKAISLSLERFMESFRSNPCDHAGHRTQPLHSTDYVAAVNQVAVLQKLQARLIGRMLALGYNTGRAHAVGQNPQDERSYGLEGLHTVAIEAGQIYSRLLAANTNYNTVQGASIDVPKLYDDFEAELRLTMDKYISVLATGREDEEFVKRNRTCH